MENKIGGTITLNSREYIAKDKVIEDLVKAVLEYHYDGDMGVSDYEVHGLELAANLLGEETNEYKSFCESYIHAKYPQVFREES